MTALEILCLLDAVYISRNPRLSSKLSLWQQEMDMQSPGSNSSLVKSDQHLARLGSFMPDKPITVRSAAHAGG